MTYAFIVEWMTAEDREAFDKELPLPPKVAKRGAAPSEPSRGTEALMAVMGMRQE